MMRFWYRLEYAFHMTEAYLAEHRGDYILAAEEKNAALECQRRIDLMDIQL